MRGANHAAVAAPIPSDLVDRLAKIAGMLGSDFAGERAAAGLKATSLLREAGPTWRQLCEAAGPRAPERQPPRAPDPPMSWCDRVEDCLAVHWRMTPWEIQFLDRLATYRHRPTDKQLALLAKLHAKATMP